MAQSARIQCAQFFEQIASLLKLAAEATQVSRLGVSDPVKRRLHPSQRVRDRVVGPRDNAIPVPEDHLLKRAGAS